MPSGSVFGPDVPFTSFATEQQHQMKFWLDSWILTIDRLHSKKDWRRKWHSIGISASVPIAKHCLGVLPSWNNYEVLHQDKIVKIYHEYIRISSDARTECLLSVTVECTTFLFIHTLPSVLGSVLILVVPRQWCHIPSLRQQHSFPMFSSLTLWPIISKASRFWQLLINLVFW